MNGRGVNRLFLLKEASVLKASALEALEALELEALEASALEALELVALGVYVALENTRYNLTSCSVSSESCHDAYHSPAAIL